MISGTPSISVASVTNTTVTVTYDNTGVTSDYGSFNIIEIRASSDGWMSYLSFGASQNYSGNQTITGLSLNTYYEIMIYMEDADGYMYAVTAYTYTTTGNDTTGPYLTSAGVSPDGITVTLVYNETVANGNSANLSVSGKSFASVSYPADSTIVITLSEESRILSGEGYVTVSDNGGGAMDAEGNASASNSVYFYPNTYAIRPTLTSADISSDGLTLTVHLAGNVDIGSFVQGEWSPSVSALSYSTYSGGDVQFTFDRPITTAETVTLTISDYNSLILQQSYYAKMVGVSGFSVTNNSSVPPPDTYYSSVISADGSLCEVNTYGNQMTGSGSGSTGITFSASGGSVGISGWYVAYSDRLYVYFDRIIRSNETVTISRNVSGLVAPDDLTRLEGWSDQSVTNNSTAIATVAFVAEDEDTKGSWVNAYGSEGIAFVNRMGDTAYTGLGSGVALSGTANYVWATDQSAIQAFEEPGNLPQRLASTWYTGASQFYMDIPLGSGAHQVALYFLDWDVAGRQLTVEAYPFDDGAVAPQAFIADSRSMADFGNGKWLVYNVQSGARFIIALTGGANAVMSFVAIDPIGGHPPVSTASGRAAMLFFP